jgi:hypothetical protein
VRSTGQRGARDVDDAVEVGLDLRAEVGRIGLLDRRAVGVTRVVDDDVEPAERLHRGPDRELRGLRVGDVERDRAQPVAVAVDEVGELLRSPRGRDDPIALRERRQRDLPAEPA